MSAAPYLAIKRLHHLADQYVEEFESSFYDDNFLCGYNTLEELQRIKKEFHDISSLGVFQLDKWH